ncbi:hypothetical protein [Ochrobactrum sp. SFR4]|uniref:hypothetical protein n=1 Tax=Ochrobactrum sp. SFR4 TaxID=2717368 RepID=UPI001C8C8D2B|nr:hypothetical protein [Ochrobactrum sp. SFR4]MBX8827259.1 hypothetical protein [Ochrobactrum sp. SFR4]
MKITLGKNINNERIKCRQELDNLFAQRISDALGNKAALYAVKYSAALAHMNGVSSPLISGDADAADIIERNNDMQTALAVIETERQAVQAQIDKAPDYFSLQGILARYRA